MEITIIRLSRPLLLATGRYMGEYTYQTIYGFIIKRPIQDVKLNTVDDYTGYLAAMHLFFNGSGKDFTISWEARGVPDWVDKKGTIHQKYDAWMRKISKKSIKKLDLTYSIIPMNLDEKAYYQYVNQDMLITDEYFYWDIEDYQPEQGEPLLDDDDLPF